MSNSSFLLYSAKDKSSAASQDSLKLSNSPGSVYSTPFSRSTTPLGATNTPSSSTETTPANKDLDIASDFSFGAGSMKPVLPNIEVNDDNMEKYVADLTKSAHPDDANQARAFHGASLSVNWEQPTVSKPSFMLDPAPSVKPNLDRANSMPRAANLSIDINQANTSPVANPIRSAFAIVNSNALSVGSHSRKVSASEQIWGGFTPSSEFFGKSITQNDIGSLNNGLNLLNLRPDVQKSPLMSGFSHKYTLSGSSNLGFDSLQSSPRNAYFNSNNAASVPRSATASFFDNSIHQSIPQPPQQLSPAAMSSILAYFTKPKNSQISQLTIEGLKNLNYDKVFSSKAGQLPKFLMPGQEMEGMYSQQGQQGHQHQLVLVAFKHGRMDIFYYSLVTSGHVPLKDGDLVFVEADRGKDLGMVVSTDISIDDARLIKMIQHEEQTDALRFDNNDSGSSNNQAQPHIPKQVLRVAMNHEISQITHKQSDEQKALGIMQSKILVHKIPMKVLGAEYQWDRRKLTFFYVANKRIDFRDLVKDIFRIYKTRIWMCAVIPSDPSIKESINEEASMNIQPQFQFPVVGHDQMDASSNQVDLSSGNYSYSSIPVNLHQHHPSFGQVQFNQPQENGHMRQYSSLATGNVWNA